MIKITLVTNNPRVTDIVPETMTVREFLEKHEVNYAIGQTSIDSVPLRIGDMDKTFAELLDGAERAVVSCLAHKDNAASATIVGSACVVKSTLTPEEIKKLKKFHPESLTMVDEDGDPVFAIDIDERGPGSINSNGACFGNATSTDGKASITVLLDPTAENVEELVYERLGQALAYLEEMETSLVEMIPGLEEQERKVRAMITRL